MKLRRRKREVPGLNTTATADISFMLLVFFLVTTSMYVDKGLNRQMPPREDETQDAVDVSIDKDKIIQISLDASGNILIDDSLSTLAGAKEGICQLLRHSPADHVISISSDANCPYEAYFHLQNTITECYAIVREELAQKKFGRGFNTLANSHREEILKQCPQRVAEDYDMKEGGME